MKRYILQAPNGQVIITERQCEVLELVMHGMTNPEIAEKLIIAVCTVKVHVNHLLQICGCKNKTQLAVLAARQGV